MHVYSLRRVSFRVVVFFSYVACGQAWASETPAADADVSCPIVSKAEIQQALGVAIAEGRQLINTDPATVCAFPIGNGGRIFVLLRRNLIRDWTLEQSARMNRHGYVRIAGLGEQSFLLDMRSAGVALCVFFRDYYLQISIFNAGDAGAVRRAAESLARRAVARLAAGAPPAAGRLARLSRPGMRN
jgi:hypothetical protein